MVKQGEMLHLCSTYMAAAAAAKTSLSTIETHDSSSRADALLLLLSSGDAGGLWVYDDDTAAYQADAFTQLSLR